MKKDALSEPIDIKQEFDKVHRDEKQVAEVRESISLEVQKPKKGKAKKHAVQNKENNNFNSDKSLLQDKSSFNEQMIDMHKQTEK